MKKEIQVEGREKDILDLCKAVLIIQPDCWDNPNGPYETTCPFCRIKEKRGGGGEIWATMKELNHAQDCAYLIAKDLSTNLI